MVLVWMVASDSADQRGCVAYSEVGAEMGACLRIGAVDTKIEPIGDYKQSRSIVPELNVSSGGKVRAAHNLKRNVAGQTRAG